MKFYEFPCGCRFEILGEGPYKPYLKIDFDDIPLNCPAVWNEYLQGHTKCTFQTESQLGKQWSRRIQPWNIEHLAALISLIRPVTLKSFDSKKVNMTTHYALRKAGEEEVEYFHPLLESVLEETYGIAAYQEQLMKITEVLAGFNLQEADSFRKATGKKDAKLMTEVKEIFLKGCAKVGALNDEQAAQMWDILEKANRYSFNKSHAAAYAITSYQTMYAKVHFPEETLTSFLTFAEREPEPALEVRSLVAEAKRMEIPVRPPSLATMNEQFELQNTTIYFGLTNIKGIGPSAVKKLRKVVEKTVSEVGPVKSWSWMTFLKRIAGGGISSTVIKALIAAGALHFNMSRSRMLFEYARWEELSDGELRWMLENADENDTLLAAMRALSLSDGIHDERRQNIVENLISILESPPVSLQDGTKWIAQSEENLLGVCLTRSKSSKKAQSYANTLCKDFPNKRGVISLAITISDIRERKTKSGQSEGKMMAFATGEDDTGSVEMVIFADAYENHSDILFPGNTILVEGTKDKKFDSLKVEKAWQT